MDLVCTWLTGPDSGAEQRITWHPGPDGTTLTAVIGSAGHFRCEDPSLQAHHVSVEARALLEPDGTPPTAAQLWVTQLAGTADVHAHDGALRGRTAAGSSVLLAVGSSTCRLDVAPTPSLPAGQHGAEPSRAEQADDLPRDGHAPPRTLVRVARRIPAADELAVAQHLERVVEPGAARAAAHGDDEPAAMPERERPGGLVPTLVGLGGSAVIAVVTGRPMFLLFGALGGLVALTSWVAQWIAFRRRHRRAIDAHRTQISTRAADRTAARRHDRATIEAVTPTIAAARSAITTRSPMLWSCRSRDPDAFLVGLGIGDIRRSAASSSAPRDDMLVDVPVPAWLGPGEHLALLGPGADGIARSLVVQLVSRCGPADLRLVIDADEWQWATGLPHILRTESALADGPTAADDIVAFAVRLPSAHLVVVTTNMAALGDPASSLRRVLDNTPAALIAIGDEGTAPSGTTALLDTRSRPAMFTPDVRHSAVALPLRPAGIGAAAAAACAAALESLRDPEVPPEVAQQLPAAVDLDDLLGTRSLDPAEIAAAWSRPGTSLRLPLGISDRSGISTGHIAGNDAGATAWLDLVADGPHALVAGTTGSGKSELLRTMVVGLGRCASPQRLSMVLVDFKGGATFDLFAALPHVAAVITDLDDHLADRMLRSLRAEMRAREALLRQIGEPDIDAAHVRGGSDIPPRLVVIVDEFAALVGERPSFLHALVGIAQRGRSLGLHLVLATQRPGGVVSDDIRANTAVRIALRLHDRSDAIDVVGDDAPTSFPRRAPGRAMLRDGDRCIVVQTARCARPHAAIDAIARAASIAGCGAARPPWVAPLPERLDDLPVGFMSSDAHRSDPTATTATASTSAIGIVDDPDHQRYLPLAVPRNRLGLVVAGSFGMGVSSTLATVAAAVAAHYDRVIVIEADSAGVVWHPLDETGIVERIGTDDDRLLRLMRRHANTRRPLQRERTLVILDGIEMLRRVLGAPAHDHRLEHRHESRFDQLLGALLHPDAHIDVAVGTAEPGSVPAPLLARCDERWLLHLADPSSAAALGLSPRVVPPPIPGRLVVAGLEAQVLAPPARARIDAPTRVRRPRLELVPEQLDLESIVREAAHAAMPHGVAPVGVDLETGLIAGLAVQAGDTIMVAGPLPGERIDIARAVTAAIQMRGPSPRVLHLDLADIDAGVPDAVDTSRAPELRAHIAQADLARTDIAPADIVVVSGTGHDLRRREGWWTSRVRRARAGVVVASPDAGADGELLGVVLPRGFPASSHPQRGWLVDHGAIAPVQIARQSPAQQPAEARTPAPAPAPAPAPMSEWRLPLGTAWRPLSDTRR